jgi:transposase InsO family protein
MNHADWERHADDVALARYSVISPLICRQLSPAERVQLKVQILAALHLGPDGKSRRVSRRCLERWCSWYANGHTNKDGEICTEPGIEALRPLPRLDLGQPRVLDEAIVDRAIALRREEPSRTTSTLIELLTGEAAANGTELPTIVEATLAYHLRRRNATKKDLKRESRAFPRYEQPRRNCTWQGDWTQGFPIPDPSSPDKPRLCHLHAFIDDHTRYVVHAEFYFRQNLPCLEDCFRKAIVHGGIPEKVYWDNGAVYQSRQLQLIAARLGTEVIFATPYAPEGKGKVERWFQTVKTSFYPEAKRSGLGSLAELNEFFWEWLERVYQTKVHSQTEMTPLARWELGAASVRYPEPARLVDLFLWEEKRRVDKAGCIHLSGNAYPVAEHLVGREVVIRFDPFDLSRVRLYENGHFAQVLEPQTLVSQTFRKATPKARKDEAPLASSQAYRDRLTESFRRRARQISSQVRGKNGAGLSQPEFLAIVQEYLGGRVLTASEGRAIEDFYLRQAPFAQALVRAALVAAVEAKGTSLHVRYYLSSIQAVRLEGGAL